MLRTLEAKENEEIREFFRESGYTMEALRTHFGSAEVPRHLLKLYMLSVPVETSRLGVLLRWFWIGVGVEAAAAREAIPERMIELFAKAGLLSVRGDSLISPVHITSFAEFLVVSDRIIPESGKLGANAVLWPNPTTLMCHQFCKRTPVGRTLDLGTGSGILALPAAMHSGSVVATDVNPRAGEFCSFNAALNGLRNIDFREGSAFEPVSGERFDLIVMNPPFFVTPSVERIFSDNSMELDGFCRMLVRQAPEHLNENGYCQMLVEWVEIEGQPWHERVTEWVENLGCDVMVLAGYSRTAASYSMIRIQEALEELNAAAHAELMSKWQAYFASHRVKAIYGGMIALRKREGHNWIQMEEMYAQPVGPFGNFVVRCFENRDALERHSSDEALSATCPLLPPDSRLRQQFGITPEGWRLTSVELCGGEGLPITLALQPKVAEFLALCDGKRTLGETADQIAAGGPVEPAVVRRECCAMIRKLAVRGIVQL